MQVLQKINKYISQILKVALIACFTYMTVVLSPQVFGRYLFHKGFSWTEETARYIMIWAVFLGAAYIALNLEHVKVSIIEDLMKKQKHKQILELVQHIAGFIFVVIVLKYGFMQMTIAKLSKSANTGLSMMFPYLVFPVAFALLSYAYFYRALDDIVKLTKKDQTEGGEGQ